MYLLFSAKSDQKILLFFVAASLFRFELSCKILFMSYLQWRMPIRICTSVTGTTGIFCWLALHTNQIKFLVRLSARNGHGLVCPYANMDCLLLMLFFLLVFQDFLVSFGACFALSFFLYTSFIYCLEYINIFCKSLSDAMHYNVGHWRLCHNEKMMFLWSESLSNLKV